MAERTAVRIAHHERALAALQASHARFLATPGGEPRGEVALRRSVEGMAAHLGKLRAELAGGVA